MTLAELIAEANRLSSKIDEGVRHLARAAQSAADAEFVYRRSKARAWTDFTSGTVPERQAAVDGATADDRFHRDLAEGERLAALEALRSRRAQLSALQSIAAAYRAEAEHGRYGPETGP